MNTAERRWMILAAVPSEADWHRLHFTVADFAVEAIIETGSGAEIYFRDADEARACAAALGLPGEPMITAEGPGDVFGEQSHPTTELCLELIPPEAARSVADIGSGTGRLALQAAQRGAQFTIAVDLDWPAAQATRDTLRQFPRAYAVQASADALAAGAFDLILANLHLSLWRELAPEIGRIASPVATLVASGFLESQVAEAEAMLASEGWLVVERKRQDGWLAIRAKRNV